MFARQFLSLFNLGVKSSDIDCFLVDVRERERDALFKHNYDQRRIAS